MGQQEIHDKGFSLYNKIKVGGKTLENAVLDLDTVKKDREKQILFSKNQIIKAYMTQDVETLRKVSKFYYNSNGIYKRICKYFAFLYRYDWYIVPEIYDQSFIEDEKNVNKVLTDFAKALDFLDNSYIKNKCGEIALNVIVEGAYYGYKVITPDGLIIQDLPLKYCRSRYSINGLPVVEFNMQFFDTVFPDATERVKVLKLFPDDFKKGYVLFKAGKLPSDKATDKCGCWYALEPGSGVKFGGADKDIPMFANVIPDLIDLEQAKIIDKRRQLQKLAKILVQKLPLDKNGDLIFDVDEAKDIHDNAVAMVNDVIGVDVITTFADIDDIDVSSDNASSTDDALERNERSVYNAFGVAKGLFNSDGNLAMAQSILNDESSLRNLLFSFNVFYNQVIKECNYGNRKKYKFRLYMLETTQSNYKELSKMYKEQTQIGYSKMLPQIALGHSQSAILNSAVFENQILDLSSIMIPPLMSSVMSGAEVLGVDKNGKLNTAKNQDNTENTGRPEKSDAEKSDKTIANKNAEG